ncbi:MAG: PorP/SprF family type IX secretion system membrane protein [Crocinitomicaceae bacterium]
MRLLICALLFSANVLAQDIHFSQLSVNNLISNPASAGFYDGWERLAISHKNQWINANTSFLTTSISADFNLFKPRSDKGAYLGVGILFFNDISGDSKFGTRHFSACLSGIVPLNRNNRVSFGFSPGFGQKSADLGQVLFSNQFDGQVLNSSINSGEIASINTKIYGDFSFGFLYQYGTSKRNIVANRKVSFSLGVSYYHFNTPRINFNDTYFENLFGKISIGSELIKDFEGSDLGVETFVNYHKQGPHQEVYGAALLRYQMAAGSKMTRLRKQVIFSIGLGYRAGDAIVPMVRYQKASWQFGMSYDVTISTLGNFSRGGGLEFNLIFNSTRFAVFKRR